MSIDIKIKEPIKLVSVSDSLSLAIQAALDGAKDPSADNVFMTAQDMLLTLQFEDGSFSIPVDTDIQLVIRYTGADDITVTLSNDLIKGKVYTITQAGAGVVTLEGDTDVTVNSLDGLKTPGQAGHIQFWKSGDNLFDTVGGVE